MCNDSDLVTIQDATTLTQQKSFDANARLQSMLLVPIYVLPYLHAT